MASWHYGPGASLLVGGFRPLLLLPSTKSKYTSPVVLRTGKTEEKQKSFKSLPPFQEETSASNCAESRVCSHSMPCPITTELDSVKAQLLCMEKNPRQEARLISKTHGDKGKGSFAPQPAPAAQDPQPTAGDLFSRHCWCRS